MSHDQTCSFPDPMRTHAGQITLHQQNRMKNKFGFRLRMFDSLLNVCLGLSKRSLIFFFFFLLKEMMRGKRWKENRVQSSKQISPWCNDISGWWCNGKRFEANFWCWRPTSSSIHQQELLSTRKQYDLGSFWRELKSRVLKHSWND